MKIIILLLVFTLWMPFSVAAQTSQTVNGAQEFLAQVLKNGASSLDFDSGLGWDRVRPANIQKCFWHEEYTFLGGMKRTWECFDKYTFLSSSDNWVEVGSLQIKDAIANGPCKTRIIFDNETPRERRFQKRDGSVMASYTLTSGSQNEPLEIDWTKVAGTSNTEKSVSLAGINPKMDFNMPSKEMAIRVAYAMEFLRLSCDKTSATGF